MPRRSAGCETCRSRKVRCDLTRPFCRNCTDRSLECGGYRPEVDPPGHKFEDQTEKTVARATGALTRRGRRQSTSAIAGPSSSSSEARMDLQLQQRRTMSLSTIDAPALQQAQALSRLLDMTFPNGSPDFVPAHYEWLKILPTISPGTGALPSAISALCGVHLGTTLNDQHLLRTSRNLYTTALRRLSAAVSRPQANEYDQTFAAIMTLTLCELFHVIAEDGTGWQSHVRGAGSFLQIHGPSAISSPLSRLLLHNARLSSIYLGELHRKTIFLDHSRWLNVTSEDAISDSFTAMIDVCVRVPTLMDHCMVAINSNDINQVPVVLLEAQSLQTQFATWFDRHLRHSGFEWVTMAESPLFRDFHINGIFPFVFIFPNLRMGCLHIKYWTARLNIARSVIDMVNKFRKDPQDPSLSNEAKSAEFELALCATKVCQCVPYCCQPAPGALARICGLLCLVVAYEVFDAYGYQEQSAWCHQAFRIIRNSGVVQPGPFPFHRTPNPSPPKGATQARIVEIETEKE